MAVYSIKEFSEITGVKINNIYTYIGRKKIVKNKKGEIDTSNVLNEIFLSKRTGNKPIINKEIESVKNIEKKNGNSEKKQETQPTGTDSATALIQLEYATKKLQAQKIQKDIALKDLEIKKKNNELFELDKFISIAKSYSETLKRELHERMKLLIQDICARHDIETGKTGEYKLKVTDIINDSSDSAIDKLMKGLK